jgi:hypothetical protein
VFTIPAKSLKRGSVGGNDGDEIVRQRNSNPFLDGLSKLVGSGGLEDSMHNPNRNRRLSQREKEPLLKDAGEMDGYWPRSSGGRLSVASVTKVTNVVRIGVEFEEKDKNLVIKVEGEFKMAWLWVEGWRARLRAGGDLVEKCKYDFEG